MPFHISPQQNPLLHGSHIPHSANTTPEMRLWEQAKAFFDLIHAADAQACIRNICQPPVDTTRESVVDQFEQLRTFAYPTYRENIQSGRHGENHFCLLGDNSQELLSVTLGDSGTYTVEYEGRRVRFFLTQSQQENGPETENIAAEANAPLTAEEYKTIWSDWACVEEFAESYQYYDSDDSDDSDDSGGHDDDYVALIRERTKVIKQLRHCLRHNHTSLVLGNLSTVDFFPEVLPPQITELTIEHMHLDTMPPLPAGLQRLNLIDITMRVIPILPPGLKILHLKRLHTTTLPELPPGLEILSFNRLNQTHLPELPSGLREIGICDLPHLRTLPSLPAALQRLKIHRLSILHLPPLPNGLTEIDIDELSHLHTLPSLPPALQRLVISEAALTHLPGLPSELTEIGINDLPHLRTLPSLPPSLQRLVISATALTHLPPLPNGLAEIDIYDHPHLHTLPSLPPALQRLKIHHTSMPHLPPLPNGLTEIDIYDHSHLSTLPSLPPALRRLAIYYTPLPYLPPLPNGLAELDIHDLPHLRTLPSLPPTLQRLTIHDTSMPHLPPLPNGLNRLALSYLPLTRLPELPPTLQHLHVSHAPLISGLEDVVNLPPTASIRLRGSAMSERMIQSLRDLTRIPGYSGPTIEFDMAVPSAPREVRSLHQAVADWFTPIEGETTASTDKWLAFEQEEHAPSFSLFLDRLSDTRNFRQNSGFKAQISSWLTQLADDHVLRAKTFSMATEATSSCEDRVTQTMNQMKCMQLVHQAENGEFDKRLPELVAAGREMFRLEKLEQIARGKTQTLRLVDEIEVWLGYQNKLRDTLELTSITAEMRFFGVSGITESDLRLAETQVKRAENSQFADWIRQWAPLHGLLQRTESKTWKALIEKKRADYEHHYQILSDSELKPAGLVGDLGAEQTIGTRAMEKAEALFLEGLRELTAQTLGAHLQAYWFNEI